MKYLGSKIVLKPYNCLFDKGLYLAGLAVNTYNAFRRSETIVTYDWEDSYIDVQSSNKHIQGTFTISGYCADKNIKVG